MTGIECKDKSCEFRFDTLEVKLEKMDELNQKRAERDSVIERAIVEIQTSNKLTAETLSRLETRFEGFSTASNDKWFKLVEKAIVILAGIIGVLIGQKVL